jgi:hypothetical protein
MGSVGEVEADPVARSDRIIIADGLALTEGEPVPEELSREVLVPVGVLPIAAVASGE